MECDRGGVSGRARAFRRCSKRKSCARRRRRRWSIEGATLTYAALNAQANRLAHYLRGCGVEPDARVAICVERGPELVVSLLAVLKAGGAYVPLDPAAPFARLRFLVDDCAPIALLRVAHARRPVRRAARNGAPRRAGGSRRRRGTISRRPIRIAAR